MPSNSAALEAKLKRIRDLRGHAEDVRGQASAIQNIIENTLDHEIQGLTWMGVYQQAFANYWNTVKGDWLGLYGDLMTVAQNADAEADIEQNALNSLGDGGGSGDGQGHGDDHHGGGSDGHH